MAQSMAQALLEAGLVTEKQVEAVGRELRRRPEKRREAQTALDQMRRVKAISSLEGLTGIQAMDLGAARGMMQMLGVFPFCCKCKRIRRDTKIWMSDDRITCGSFCEECRLKLSLTVMFMDCSLDTFRKEKGLEPLPEGTDFPDLQALLDSW